ncbi:GumC family protein [Vacuolonema iberomarrocanum]|uniref:GumC family protein n=1 Tax=Vacuolonema iberomarrocanum TaxID=3454632 RepID=UPI0019E8E29D|nr:polysaccharide biosynthesis tyrosine autokinase [filamentous cyanobacterium LEGE 07170]
MPENRNDELSNEGLGYGQILSVLSRQRLWIIGALCVTLPLAAFNSLQKEPTFRSSMQLLVEPNYRDPDAVARARADDIRFAEGAPPEIDYATQIRIMQGSALLRRAAEILELEYPDIDIDAAEIQQRLAVFRVTETEDEVDTNILQADYTDNDPERARIVLEAIQDVYQEYNLEQQSLRLETGLSFINDQLPIAAQELEDAEESLELYREGRGLIDPQQQADELTTALAAVEQERRDVRSEFEDLQAQYDILQRQLERSPQDALLASRLSESERYQNLLNEYQLIEVELADLAATFTGDAPNIRLLRQELENQRALLQQEIDRVLGGSGSGVSASDVLSQGQLGDVDLTLVGELAQIQTRLSGLAARDSALAQTEASLRQDLTLYPGLIAEYDRLQPEIEIQRDTLQQLLRARQELSIDIARGGYRWETIEPPEDGIQTGPNVRTDLIIGGIAGLFLGIVLAFIREALDNKLRTTEQLRELGTVPQLGSLPWFRRDAGSRPALAQVPFIAGLLGDSSTANESSPQIFQALQWLPFRESMDLVYKNIQLLNPNKDPLSIAITSALPGEGKSTIALGLAITAARLHQRVLLIDADLRNPSLHNSLNLPSDRGLTTTLTDHDPESSIYRISWVDCALDLLPAGPVPPDPVRLLSSQAMHDTIRQLERNYDLILLDASPVIGTADALQTASVCRNTLLVACLGQVSKAEVSDALSLLQRFNLIGIVANGDRSLRRPPYAPPNPRLLSPATPPNIKLIGHSS